MPGMPNGGGGGGGGTGRLIGQNFYTGQNRNMDPSIPFIGRSPDMQDNRGPPPERMMPPQQQPPPPPPSDYYPANIEVKVEKSEEEKELYRYMRNRLGEDWDRMRSYFREKCKRMIRRAGGSCGCVGVSEHMKQCSDCRGMCHQKQEFRANLTLYLLIGVFILLVLNLLFPRGIMTKKTTA
jgi:hypothetical protein